MYGGLSLMKCFGFNNKASVFFVIFLLSVAFLLLLSPTTSILYNEKQFSVDGTVFHIVGRYWFEDGTLPYVGLWDLKGPIIYLLNGIGFLISHSEKGMFVVQTVFLLATLYITYHFFYLNYNALQSLVLTFGASLCLALNYESGNCVEEFCLPFLVLSYYYIYRWSLRYNKDNIVEHDSKLSVIYGMSLGVSLLTRLTNAIGFMGAVAFICIVIIINKKWCNLVYNALFFILGFLIIVLPFVLYFSANNALYDMWYGTVLYNMEYAKNSVGGHSLNSLLSIYIYGTALLIYGIYKIAIEKKYINGSLWFFSIIMMQYWLFGSNGYAHYGLLCYPALCVLVNEVSIYIQKKHIPIRFFLIVFMIFGLTVFGLRFQRTLMYSSSYNDNRSAQLLIDKIPNTERNSVIMYNCNGELYLLNDIKPDNPYFSQQEFESQRGPSLANRVYNSFNDRNSKWIIYHSSKNESIISPILNQKYHLLHEIGNYKLYRLKL